MTPRRSETPTSEQPRRVYGYVRVNEQDDAEVARLRNVIHDFCVAEALHLANTFVDRGSDGTEIARPGFGSALEHLATPECFALIVVDDNQFSPDQIVRDALTRQARRAASAILTVYATDGGPHCGSNTHSTATRNNNEYDRP